MSFNQMRGSLDLEHMFKENSDSFPLVLVQFLPSTDIILLVTKVLMSPKTKYKTLKSVITVEP